MNGVDIHMLDAKDLRMNMTIIEITPRWIYLYWKERMIVKLSDVVSIWLGHARGSSQNIEIN